MSVARRTETRDSQPVRGTLLYCWDGPGVEPELVLREPAQLGPEPYDVVIVGAGVVGCALAFELSQYRLRVLLLDRGYDVGEGTSKANSAIVASGFDTAPGSLETELLRAAAAAWPELARDLKIPRDPVGALLLAVDDEQRRILDEIAAGARKNGVDDVALLDAEQVRAREPNASDAVVGALLTPQEAIIDPFSVSIAFAEVALQNGVDIVLGAQVVGVDAESKGAAGAGNRVQIGDGWSVPCRIVVNAAGLGSRPLAEEYGGESFDTNPRRGQFLIFDSSSRGLVNHIFFPVPTPASRGILVIPTIFGNLLAGPTAEDLAADDIHATCTTVDGLRAVMEGGARLLPRLVHEPVIGSYAGLRCHCSQGSYRLRFNDGGPGIVTVSGIRSTGMSASPALARHLVAEMQARCGLSATRDPEAVTSRPDSAWPGWWKRPYDDPARVADNPDYARMACFCERISRGEVVAALDSPLRPRTMDALKRRTRVLSGRCQGFDCGVPIAEIAAGHCGLRVADMTKCGPGSRLVSTPAVGRS